jgi:hypothetical protein
MANPGVLQWHQRRPDRKDHIHRPMEVEMSTNRMILGLVIAAVAMIAALTGWEAVSVERLGSQPASAGAPGYFAGQDFAQRHPELSRAFMEAEGADYALRHPELSKASVPADNSDYFLRHPELNQPSVAVDSSDFFLRHPDWISTSGLVDTSDYALRHPELSSP